MKLIHALVLLPLASPLHAADVGASGTYLTGVHATEHFHVRYRPGSRAAASVDRAAALAELEYAEILRELGIAGRVDEDEPFLLFLYDDLDELERVTGVGGTGGFSAGRESHVPWDDDQTRKHELVHIVVAAMGSAGDEPRNMFFAEGISNAVLEFVHGVPVHAVAAFELERGSLPALRTLVEHADFYAFLGEDPGLNAYDVAGSFFLYLLETQPPPKVMDYDHGMPIAEALGAPLADVERAWHARLDAFPIRPELETLLRQRRGDGVEFTKLEIPVQRLTSDVLGDPAEWRSVLGELAPSDEVAEWEVTTSFASARNPSPGDWSRVELPGKPLGDCVLRAKARTGASCWGIQLRYGSGCEAMVLGQGTFLYTPAGGVAFTDTVRLRPDADVDLVLRLRGGHAELWVDESFVLEADLELSPSPIGLGVVGGQATFHELAVREL